MRRQSLRVAVLCGLGLCTSRGLPAQTTEDLDLHGTVLRAGEVLGGAEVVLHRVSADSAGEMGRTNTGPDGSFWFRFPYVPDPVGRGEVFFASVRHDGILYFGPSLTTALDLDSLYTIEVFDTASVPSAGAVVTAQARNLVLERLEDGWQVTDLIEVRNDSNRTWVAGRPGGEVWRVPLPPSSTGHQIGDSDLPPDGARFEGGVAHILAAVPPGARLFLFRYQIPTLGFELPLSGTTERVEVLVREPAPPLAVAGLEAAAPVELEPGTTFRRFVGENLADASITVEQGAEGESLPVAGLMVALALAMGVLGLWAFQRGPSAPGPVRTREELLLEIARLDDEIDATPAGKQAELLRRRARLTAALRQRSAGR